MCTAIQLHSITRKFGSFTAVDDLSFDVQRGEIFCMLGPNGSGKTTTIHMITGLLKRSAGVLEVSGFDPQAQPRQVRQRIGLVPQETNIYGELSALDNLWHHAGLYCKDLGQARERIEALLKLVDLWDRRKDPAGTFSGGMKRRLALARALLHDPEIILFDEPTLGVDVQGRHVLWDHIHALRDAGKTFVITTNDMTEADVLCNRLVIIDHGKCIVLDSPERLKAALGRDIVTLRTTPAIPNPAMEFQPFGARQVSTPEPGVVRFEVENAEALAGDLISRVSPHYHLENFRIARPTLDDVFLHHTGRALRE
jgi:ABC-type multidrug transport system ATPase subunit